MRRALGCRATRERAFAEVPHRAFVARRLPLLRLILPAGASNAGDGTDGGLVVASGAGDSSGEPRRAIAIEVFLRIVKRQHFVVAVRALRGVRGKDMDVADVALENLSALKPGTNV